MCARLFRYFIKHDQIIATTWGNQDFLMNRISVWLFNSFCYNLLQGQTIFEKGTKKCLEVATA